MKSRQINASFCIAFFMGLRWTLQVEEKVVSCRWSLLWAKGMEWLRNHSRAFKNSGQPRGRAGVGRRKRQVLFKGPPPPQQQGPSTAAGRGDLSHFLSGSAGRPR